MPADAEPDGIIRLRGKDGQHWVRAEFPGTLRPHWFVEAGDGADEALAIQRAFDYAARFGSFAVELGARRYRCLSALKIDPTCVILHGVGAVLDFSTMPEPPARAPAVDLEEIQPGKGWRREGGALAHSDGTEDTLTHFFTMQDEGRYRVSVFLSALSGTQQHPFARISITASDRSILGSITVSSAGYHDFEVDGAQPAARLIITSNADLQIDTLRVEWHGRRECILVQCSEDSRQYGHKGMEGIEIVGPGEGTLLHGIRFETRVPTRSSRLDMRDLVVTGFQTGILFSHRSYLVHGYNVRSVCDIALHFVGGVEDAGELISFFGCIFGGGGIGILNNNAEVMLFGTSIDFVEQVFVGSGRLALQGCHLEINRPKNIERPPIDLGQGNIALDGGSFGITGHDFDAGNQCQHIFLLRSRDATASMREITVYNLRSQSGALAGGPGRLETSNMRGNSRPRYMAPIVQFAEGRNMLGPAPFDLRASSSPAEPFERFPTEESTFKVSPMFRHVGIFGLARPGAEVGAAFRIRSDVAGTILVTIQASDGDTQISVGETWTIEVEETWTNYMNNTGDTHPRAVLDGRMPDGYDEVGLLFDLSGFEGTVEVADCFLCAV